MEDIAFNWSSGKDAALAFHYLQQDGNYRVKTLLTSLSEAYERVSMHGIRAGLLELQAQKMQLPLKKIYLPEDADMETYNRIMGTAVSEIKEQGIHTMAFGDIFLEDLRRYREDQLAAAGMKTVFPLWKRNTVDLVKEVEDAGIKAMIVCVNDRYLGKEFLGRYIDRRLLQDLPAGVDPCGENGEYHTLVIDAPFFRGPLPVSMGEIVYKTYSSSGSQAGRWDQGFYYLDVLPADQ